MTESPERRIIGLVTSPHGIRGTVKVKPLSDFPERFERLRNSPCFLQREGTLQEVRVRSIQFSSRHILLDLEGISSRDEAEALRGAELSVPMEDSFELPEGTYYISDLIGAIALDEAGRRIGILTDVLRGAQDLLEIRSDDGGEVLVPFVDEWVGAVRMSAGEIEIRNWRALVNVQSSTSGSDDH